MRATEGKGLRKGILKRERFPSLPGWDGITVALSLNAGYPCPRSCSQCKAPAGLSLF